MRDRACLQDVCLAHHGFTLPADLAGDLERITPHDLLAEQLNRKRSSVPLLGQLPDDVDNRCDAVVGNQS